MGQVNTDFESGLSVDWQQFPEQRWESSSDKPLSDSLSLHHSFDNASSGTDRISLQTGIYDFNDSVSWKFKLRYEYTPSSTNKWQIYLASEIGAVEAGGSTIRNAYVFGVNVSGSDDTLRLYGIQNGVTKLICRTSINYENDIGFEPFHCLIKRDKVGNWQIYSISNNDSLQLVGSAYESGISVPELNHFMISYTYTSSKDRLFWFDDLLISSKYIVDSIPPTIKTFEIINRNTLLLLVSEEIASESPIENKFILYPGIKNPDIVYMEGNTIRIVFDENFTQKTNYSLVISNLEDKKGNLSNSDTIDFFFYEAERNDLVFTEIMADPSPPVYLRESEYVELFNRSELPIKIDSFILIIGKREWLLPAYTVNPGKYLVITSGTESGYNTLPVFTSSSTITNEFQQLFLKNKYGETITASEFYKDWYRDDFKSEGGWSLERINADMLCGGKENWRASEDSNGGTPGSTNSVNETISDNIPPRILQTQFLTDDRIRLVFSKNIDPSTIPKKDFFDLKYSDILVDTIMYADFFCSSIEISFSDSLKKGSIYDLNIPVGIMDCEGNSLEIKEDIKIGIPTETKALDVLISEVMFSSLPDCSEFIELYNLSDKLLNISDLRISVRKPGEAVKPSIPLNEPVLFFPGEFLVLCKNKEALLDCHDEADPNKVLETKDLPSLTDEGTCIMILNKSLETIDEFCYEPEDEFPMLSDFHGVSLERLKLDRNTGNNSHWHSASSQADFATPGMPNSQSLSDSTSSKTFEVSPETFTPDNDGFNDFAEINYKIDKEGYIGTVAIFDPLGNKICLLGENEILGTSGTFIWDGRDELGRVCRTGLYLVYGEVWNLGGDVVRFKRVVVVVRR